MRRDSPLLLLRTGSPGRYLDELPLREVEEVQDGPSPPLARIRLRRGPLLELSQVAPVVAHAAADEMPPAPAAVDRGPEEASAERAVPLALVPTGLEGRRWHLTRFRLLGLPPTLRALGLFQDDVAFRTFIQSGKTSWLNRFAAISQ